MSPSERASGFLSTDKDADDGQRRGSGCGPASAETSVARLVAQNADELRMERLIDLLDHRRHHRFEIQGASDLLRDAAQQSLRIVSLAKKLPVDAPQPGFAVGADDEERPPDHREPPPARFQHREQRLIAMHEHVHQQDGAERRDQGSTKPRASAYRKPCRTIRLTSNSR